MKNQKKKKFIVFLNLSKMAFFIAANWVHESHGPKMILPTFFNFFDRENSKFCWGYDVFQWGFQFSSHFAWKKKKKKNFFRETSKTKFFYVFLAEIHFLSLL